MDTTRRQIIVVEDEAATRKLLACQLERAGYEVQAYSNGREALEPITALNTGIVLADWLMPEMDGLELCRTVRNLEAMQALGNIYFILLTAHSSKEETVAGLEAGANDYLTKPYHSGELLARIQVGERMLRLQEELLQKTLAFQKANSQLALLSRRLEQLANTDTLTAIANRRSLLDQLKSAWELAERHGHPLSCIMIDVDHFKAVNDTYGHEVGDRVLRRIAQTLRDQARRPDHCGRIGGEEFALVCPITDGQGAAMLAERIRVAVAELVVQLDGQSLSVTVSCGVAEKTLKTASADELLRQADAVLYIAKQNGQNQTWLADGKAGTPIVPATVA